MVFPPEIIKKTVSEMGIKQWGVEHRQPHSSPFVCIFPHLPRLASASSRHLRKNPCCGVRSSFGRAAFRQVK